MEPLSGGAIRFRHQRSPPSAERFLGILQPQSSSPTAPPLELSEHDIFTTLSASSPPSPTPPNFNSDPRHRRSNELSHRGILAALNGDPKTSTDSGSDARPVFNHKASASASISSSLSISPAMSTSSRMMIPRPPPPRADRFQPRNQSAPVNIPAMRRRGREFVDVVSEGEEEEEDDDNGVVLPPHEVVASRHSPMLACSVLEGAGRTLKGRDLRQVRNAIWRKTGFID